MLPRSRRVKKIVDWVRRMAMLDSTSSEVSREVSPISTEDDHRISYQPLHPSVRDKLSPTYVAFHDSVVQYIEPDDVRPWDGSSRTRTTWPYAGQPVVEVGEVKDVALADGRFHVRIFTPQGKKPCQGWPVLLWFHGGGWAGGNIDSDNDFCSLACRDASCVVITVDYRLAPENPFPAAVHDALDTLNWVLSTPVIAELGTDSTRIAIGGVSAGANVAAVLLLKAIEMQLAARPIYQLLIVPAIDNRATVDNVWAPRRHAPWLTASRMTWYRRLYLPNMDDAQKWEASPNLAPLDMIRQVPKTWIAVAGQDLLYTEGVAFAKQLQDAGVCTELHEYAGMPHNMMVLSSMLEEGKQVMHDAVNALSEVFASHRGTNK